MSAEFSQKPTKEEWDQHVQKVGESFEKAKVAATVSGGFALASFVCPPAFTGAVVSALEMGRQVASEAIEVIKFTNKYPNFSRWDEE